MSLRAFSRVWMVLASSLLLPAAILAADSPLPDYVPKLKVTGVLRSCGNPQMAELLKRWQAGFRKFQPDVQFADDLKSSASGMYGLDMRTADLALMGRQIFPYERYGVYERSWVYPAEVQVATGSASALHKSPAYAIFVHRSNPLAQVSLKQLDGIFGAERAGGWNALTWDTTIARTRSGNLTTWGQMGLSGDWAAHPIHPYGQPLLGTGAITYFQARVFGGAEIWSEGLREYADRARMLEDLSRDPDGIAYAPAAYAVPGVKMIAVSEGPDGPFVALTPQTVADRSYPLSRPVYAYYTRDNRNTELTPTLGDPRMKEFLRYVLSRQGQDDVAAEGSYLPLPADLVQRELAQLDSKEIPPEHQFMEE